MPLNNPAPQFGLLTAYDLRDLSATQLFTRGGGSAVSLPTFTAGQGVYEDGLFFLNGRSLDADMTGTGRLSTVKLFGASWTLSLNASDQFVFSSDTDFTVTSTGSSDLLGLGSGTVSSTLDGSTYSVTCQNDWARGVANLSSVSYRLNEVGSATFFTFPQQSINIQDLSVYTRDRATINDADVFGLDSLDKLDQTAQSSDLINWYVNDNGYVECAYLTALGHITWSSSVMRDMLGFTGNETPTTYDTTYSLLTSTHKAAGVLIPSRPYQGHHLRVQNLSESRRKISGGYSSNYIGTYVTSVLSFDLDALLDLSDDYQHFIHRWLTHCSSGERVNFYQGWGDSRRSLRTDQIVGTQSAYDSLYSSEDNGEYGRIRGSLVTAEFNLAYPGRLKRRVPVSMEIEHL